MITEDYVSFEVAKLLKEKGFNEPTWTRYEDNNEVIFGDKYDWNNSPMGQISAPTLQMAMKVLREEMGIAIIPLISSILDEEKFLWDVEIVTTKNKVYRQGWAYEHLEEALDWAIQWTLENLI